MLQFRILVASTLLLLAITFVAYAGVLQNDFVDFDDNIYVTQNPFTANGLSFDGFIYAWTTFHSGNWIPLTWLSLQLDATLFGIRAPAFHAVSVLIHGINVLLLFAWLNRVTQAYWRSLIVAALFAVHPLHVESVAWVAERKDVLSAFWLLVALLAYERFAACRSVLWYLGMCIAFILGLLSKSMLVTFPVLLLFVDFWPLERWKKLLPLDSTPGRYPQRTLGILLLEKAPLLGFSVCDGIATIWAQGVGHEEVSAFTSLSRLPLPIRLGNAVQGYGWYLIKTICPTNLCVYYPHPLNHLDPYKVIQAALILLAAVIYVALRGVRQKHLLFGWLWFAVSLAPVIGLLQVGSQAYADRYSYIPHIGLLSLMVWEGHGLLCKSKLGQRLAVSVAVGTTIALGWLTASQVTVWRTTDTLWAHALSVDPDNWFAHLQIGNNRVLTGRVDDEAYKHLLVALDHQPRHAIALNNVGWIHECRGEWSEAEVSYRKALAIDIRLAVAAHNLVTVLKKQQRIAEGFELFQAYAEKRPADAKIQNELGLIHARRGQMNEALARFTKAVTSDQNDVSARNNLALVYSQLGRDGEAQSELEKVLSQKPDDGNAHVNLGVLLEKHGQLITAREHFAAALKTNPNDREAAQRIQVVNERLGQP